MSLYPDIPVWFVGPLWRTDLKACEEKGFPLYQALVDMLLEGCCRYPGVTTVDGMGILPHSEQCMADHVHPNGLGFSYLADAMERVMKEKNGK